MSFIVCSYDVFLDPKQQICVWSLQILLLFTVNKAPISAINSTADTMAVLQAGQRTICLDR